MTGSDGRSACRRRLRREHPERRGRGPAAGRATTSPRWPTSGPTRSHVVVDDVERVPLMPPRLAGLTKLTLETAPTRLPQLHLVAVARPAHRRQGSLDGEGRARLRRVGHGLLRRRRPACSARCSTGRRPRSRARDELPGGPPSDDAMLVTCAYLVDDVEPVGAAVALPGGDRRGARSRCARARGVLVPVRGGRVGVRALPGAQDGLPADFLADFGFVVLRAAGRVGLSRLELGGLQPVAEGKRETVLRVVKEAFGVPEAVPAPRP